MSQGSTGPFSVTSSVATVIPNARTPGDRSWIRVMGDVKKWLLLVVLAASCANEAVHPELVKPEIVCAVFNEVRSSGSADTLDESTVERLLHVLPDDFHGEVALFYYPFGGSVSGLDTSGTAAEKVGWVLNDLYRRNC